MFNFAVWRAIQPAELGISTLSILLTMKMSEEGKEHPPERNQNLPSDTAITFHALKLFHCVKNIKHKGFCPLLAGVIVYHPSGKQGNY